MATAPADHARELHTVGFFRAIGSAFDCLGGVVTGVVGLAADLRTADLERARDALRKASQPDQTAFAQQLETYIRAAGPAGWLEWSTDYRNMLVNRARRMSITEVEPRGGTVLDPSGRPIVLARELRHLAQAPDLSEVEVFAAASTLALGEDGATTMTGILGSAIDVADKSAAALLAFWKLRRSKSGLIAQSDTQWKAARNLGGTFAGYAPRKLQMNLASMFPHDVHRFKSAALDDKDRPKWTTQFR